MNILILSGKFNAGHTSAATAIRTLTEARLGDTANITLIDLPEYISQEGAALWYSIFDALANHMSPLYNAYYRMSAIGDGGKLFSPLRVFSQRMNALLDEHHPDVVISTHPVCSFLAARCRRHGANFTLITCLTDLSTHPEWVNKGTDYYCVGSRDIAVALEGQGVPRERILLTGIPLHPEFYSPLPQKEPGSKKELLLMGGGAGLLPTKLSFYERLAALEGVHTTVITGRNKKLYERLAGKFENITVLGFVSDVRARMAHADLLVSKAGGITLFEALYSGIPLLVPDPAMEQEKNNAALASARGAAVVAPKDPDRCLNAIASLLKDHARLRHMSAVAAEIRSSLRPNALYDLLSRLAERKGAVRHAA